MIKVYSYSRWSTPEQAQGQSADRQKALVDDYVKRMQGTPAGSRWVLQKEDVRVDDGKSGFDASNLRGESALATILAEIKARIIPRGSVLLVESLDRLSRQNSWAAGGLLREIIDNGVEIHTLAPLRVYSAETLAKDSMLQFEILLISMRANDESVMKQSRIRHVWKVKRASATGERKPMTKRCPAWLQINAERTGFELIEERAEIVRRIYRETIQGIGYATIAATLNTEGVPPFGDSSRKAAMYWHRSYVYKILNSPAVIGTLVPHTFSRTHLGKTRTPQEPIEGYYPAAVPEKLYQKVRAMQHTDAGSSRRGRHAASPVQSILAGLSKCARCGAAMTRVNKTSAKDTARGHAWVYLVCTTARAKAGCQYTAVPYGKVEEAFLGALSEICDEAPAGLEAADLDEAIKGAAAMRLHVGTLYEDELRALTSNRPGASADTLRRLQEELARLTSEQQELEARRAREGNALIVERMNDLQDACGDRPLDRTVINARARQVFDAVMIDPDTAQLAAFFKHGGNSRPFVYDDAAYGRAVFGNASEST